MDLDNMLNNIVKSLPLPNFVEDGIITIKDSIKTFADNFLCKNSFEKLW